jgi:hypothetical protein
LGHENLHLIKNRGMIMQTGGVVKGDGGVGALQLVEERNELGGVAGVSLEALELGLVLGRKAG